MTEGLLEMTTFRLIRRLLLCSIVSVTVFGASGWLLRPSPKWEVVLHEPGFDQYFQFHDDVDLDGEPGIVWLWTARSLENDGREDLLVGVGEATGEVLRKVRFTNEFGSVLPDGRVLAKHDETKRGDPYTVLRTRFRLRDRDDTLIVERIWDGKWTPTPTGLEAAHWTVLSDEVRLTVRSIQSGEVLREMTLKGVKGDLVDVNVDASRDAKLVAVSERIRPEKRAPFGLELWDVETQRIIRRLTIPNSRHPTPDDGASYPRFASNRPELHFRWDWNRESETEAWNYIWRFQSPKDDDLIEEGPPIPADGGATKLYEPSSKGKDGERTLWTTIDNERDQFWYSIQDGESAILPWRRFPFPIPTIEHGEVVFMSYEPECFIVPKSTGLIFISNDAPVYRALPKRFRQWTSEKWNYDFPDRIVRWHDWKSNSWRDVGAPTDQDQRFYDKTMKILPNAFLMTRDSGGYRTTLQSWPLPPRDPKWPAAAIGVASAAVVWWLGAKRAARRKLLAAA
jgi:hypothetical protein